MPSLDFIHQPLDDIVDQVRSRKVSPVALMEFVIERVKLIHKQLNVVVEDRFDAALADARRVASEIARGEGLNRPLLGIPFSLKANISMMGMRLDMGTWSMHGQRATTTATAIRRLIEAGAIPVCTTNLSELALWHDTVNPIYGRTINPWKSSRIVGGSSGGEAALIAAGGTLFGIATDLDGSLRIPASFCGVFSHRPSRGTVPLTGQFPFFKPEDEIRLRALDSLGPMTRYAVDLELLFEVIAGPCSQDPMSLTGVVSDSVPELTHVKIAVMQDPLLKGRYRTSSAVRLAMHKAEQRLKEAGADVVDAPADLFFDGHMLWRMMIHRATQGRLAKIFHVPNRRSSFKELGLWLGGQGERCLASCITMIADQRYLDADRLRTLDSDFGLVRRRIDSFLTKVDAIVCPIYPELPPSVALSVLSPPNLGLTGLVNTLGLPVSTAPVVLSSSGLPIGAQAIGRLGEDRLTMLIADTIGEYIPSPLARSSMVQLRRPS